MNRKQVDASLDWLEGWIRCWSARSESWLKALNIARALRRYLHQNQPYTREDTVREVVAALIAARKPSPEWIRLNCAIGDGDSEVLESAIWDLLGAANGQ